MGSVMSPSTLGHFAASCFGKTAYLTKMDAIRVLGFRLKRGQGLSAYRCDHCKQWHLGR